MKEVAQTSTHGILESSLIESYRQISKESLPEWAVHKRNSNELVKPTIPFVGKHYAEQVRKILVYASAENLADYWKGNDKHWVGDWLDDDSQAENRHRKCFDDPGMQGDPFFPHVHIGPMNNGCLATAAYYIASKLYQLEFSNPRDFYETIAFGNYGKYSIETALQRSKRLGIEQNGGKANIDYAGNKELLAASHAFLRADLSELKPDCIILPKAMYEADRVFIDQHKGHAVIVPIHQINTRVINLHIAPKHSRYDIERLPRSVQVWYERLQQEGMTGKNKENFLSVFTYLDSVLEHDLR